MNENVSASVVPAEIVAVIAAAVAMMIEVPHRIISIAPIDPGVVTLTGWAFEGRVQLHTSHNTR